MEYKYCEECEDYKGFYYFIDLGKEAKLKCVDCDSEYNPNVKVKEKKEVQEEM